jgi:hypothetical protein
MSEKDRIDSDVLNGMPDNKKEKTVEEDSTPLQSSVETSASHWADLIFGYLILLFILYGFLSFVAQGVLSELWDNPLGTLGILTFGFVMLNALIKFSGSLSSSSFVEIDRKARGEPTQTFSGINRIALSTLMKGVSLGAMPLTNTLMTKVDALLAEQQKVKNDKPIGRERPLGTAFELQICSVVESLDKHISLTEEKASNLLDRGLQFLFGGIVFYVVVIAVWQVWAKYGEPKDNVMYIGMFASSVVFLVCEFLAAWFLKQYRHYVDASLACLRVKSVYDRYLLSYYAVKEIGSEADGVTEKLNRVLEVIKEDVMWPGHKENMGNDFNYMLESMTSIHASLDKFKGIFESKGKTKKLAAR